MHEVISTTCSVSSINVEIAPEPPSHAEQKVPLMVEPFSVSCSDLFHISGSVFSPSSLWFLFPTVWQLGVPSVTNTAAEVLLTKVTKLLNGASGLCTRLLLLK